MQEKISCHQIYLSPKNMALWKMNWLLMLLIIILWLKMTPKIISICWMLLFVVISTKILFNHTRKRRMVLAVSINFNNIMEDPVNESRRQRKSLQVWTNINGEVIQDNPWLNILILSGYPSLVLWKPCIMPPWYLILC